MKSKLSILLVLIIVAISLVGCGAKEKVGVALNPHTEQEINQQTEPVKENPQQENVETQAEASDDIRQQAKKEGVSVNEMQKTLDGLTKIGAEKYGVSEADYVKQIEASGNTVLSEWQVVSEHMGISITELYEYEKQNANNMSDEQKEIMAGMNNAIEMAESELDDMSDEQREIMSGINNIIGINENDTGEIRAVEMTEEELKQAFAYEVYKVTQEYTDEYSIIFDYTSDCDIEDLVSYYEELIINTKGYMKLQPAGVEGAMFQGMINEMEVYIDVDNSQGGMATVATYIDLSTKK